MDHPEKVPTEIAYRTDKEPLWGYQIPPGMSRYSNFKLALEDTPLQSEYDDPRLSEPISLPPGKDAVDVAADYLRLLDRHLLHYLETKMHHVLILDDTPIHYILTVPANWSDRAQKLTKDAAVKAGISGRCQDRLTMTTEPLAAATFALKDLESLTTQSNKASLVGICYLP
jgi:hypothetical protein